MFNDDFYPSPKPLVEKMVEKLGKNWRSKYKYLLEPSAGKADLIELYKEIYEDKLTIDGKQYKSGYKSNDLRIDVIEIDENLISILRGKDYNVIDRDFLNHIPQRYYDLIIANFPFSDGVKHFLKAIEIQKRIGGDIVAIINAETLKNTYSNDRIYLKQQLEDYNADIEFIENAFTDAERKTGVEIALVYVSLPMVDKESMFEKDFKRDNPHVNFQQFNAVTTKMGKLEQLCFEYRLIVESTVKIFEEKMRVDMLLEGFGVKSKIKICNDLSRPGTMDINKFIEETNQTYWNKFIQETELETRLPSELKNKFRAEMQKQKNIAFNIENLKYFMNQLLASIPLSYEKTAGDIFVKCTREYNYTESEFNRNIHYYNSWKTNNAFAIKKKIIIPCGLSNPNYISCSLPDELMDLDIVFNNIAGIKATNDMRYTGEAYNGVKNNEKKIETTHFIIDSYKKGTIHIHFKNKDHLAMFNYLGAKGLNWIDGGFANKSYQDMTKEEKDIVKAMGFEPMQFNSMVTGNREYVKLLC